MRRLRAAVGAGVLLALVLFGAPEAWAEVDEPNPWLTFFLVIGSVVGYMLVIALILRLWARR